MGQIGIKFGKNVNRCALLNLNTRILKIFQNCNFGVALTGLHVTGLQVRGYVFFDLAKPFVY